jgi:hypothetical protein
MRRDLWAHAALCASNVKKDDDAMRRATGLAVDLRNLGLVRGLEWLAIKPGGKEVRAGVLRALDVPESAVGATIRGWSRTRLLAAHGRAIEFAEALHLLVKAEKIEKAEKAEPANRATKEVRS